jgi:hypothetical protein
MFIMRLKYWIGKTRSILRYNTVQSEHQDVCGRFLCSHMSVVLHDVVPKMAVVFLATALITSDPHFAPTLCDLF